MAPAEKACKRCLLALPMDAFSKSSKGKHGRASMCRKCHKEHYYKPNWHRYHLARSYGITPEIFGVMLASQAGVCAVCSGPFVVTPSVDHDHQTGQVRGLLCAACNTGMGHFRDNPQHLRAAAAYLEFHHSTG